MLYWSVEVRLRERAGRSERRVVSLYLESEFLAGPDPEPRPRSGPPRHVLSNSSYALPYRATGDWGSLGIINIKTELDVETNLKKDKDDKDPTKNKESGNSNKNVHSFFTSVVRSGKEKLQKTKKKRSVKDLFEKKIDNSIKGSNYPDIHTIA